MEIHCFHSDRPTFFLSSPYFDGLEIEFWREERWSIFRFVGEGIASFEREKEMAALASSGRTKRDYFRVISRKRPRGTLSSVGDPFVFRSQALSQPPCAEPGNVGYEPCSKFSLGARLS